MKWAFLIGGELSYCGVHEIDGQTSDGKKPPERRLQPGLAAPQWCPVICWTLHYLRDLGNSLAELITIEP
jgi:hypothetical protein